MQKKIREENGSINVYKITKNLGIKVDYPQRPNGGGHILQPKNTVFVQ